MLSRICDNGQPDIIVLIQPTSPFLLPEHIKSLTNSMIDNSNSASAQTVTVCPHNHHAWNQRIIKSGLTSFHYSDERKTAYNKQRKPKFYVFGNLVAVKPQYLREHGFFAEPSVAVEIPRPYDFDVDGPDDLNIAEAILNAKLVKLEL